jgi:DNA-binding NarL/FixJ family response regulator
MADKIRVVVTDDEAPYRKALEKTLNLMPDCEVVAVCKDGQEALDACLADPPDVLLTDINMPRMSGIELSRRLLKKEKDVKVVILTVKEDDDTVYEAFRAGALGYLLKTSTPQDVIEGIRLAEKGEAKITPRIATKVLEDFRRVK